MDEIVFDPEFLYQMASPFRNIMWESFRDWHSSQFALAEAIFDKSASLVPGHWAKIDAACSAYKVLEEEELLV